MTTFMYSKHENKNKILPKLFYFFRKTLQCSKVIYNFTLWVCDFDPQKCLPWIILFCFSMFLLFFVSVEFDTDSIKN